MLIDLFLRLYMMRTISAIGKRCIWIVWFALTLLSVCVYSVGMFHHHHGAEVVVPLVHAHTPYCAHVANDCASSSPAGAHDVCQGQQQMAVFHLRDSRVRRLPHLRVPDWLAVACRRVDACVLLLSFYVVRQFANVRGRWRPCLLCLSTAGLRAPPFC